MRQFATGFVLLVWLSASASSASYAQDKKACDLLTKEDVESVLGVTLQRPESRAGGVQCVFVPETQSPTGDNPSLFVDVHYSAAPNPAAVEQYLKASDEDSTTIEIPVEVPGIGDAAIVSHRPNPTLRVFRGGTMTFDLWGNVSLEQVKALAFKVLGGPGKTGYVYGTRVPLKKPVLGKLGAKPSQAEQLKHDLTARGDAGDAKAQLSLGILYQFGTVVADGSSHPDYAGAAYWYQQAADKGIVDAAYRLALLYRDGLGVTANPLISRQLLTKAALSGYLPAMAPLSYDYLALKTPIGDYKAHGWADRLAQAGVPEGWLILGNSYYKTEHPDPPNWGYEHAMDAYKKAADGGSCIAMMNIGGLYFNGNGVRQDATQAQSWFAKAESCASKDLAWVREQASKYREKAATGQLPAVVQTDQEKVAAGQLPGVVQTDREKVAAGQLPGVVQTDREKAATGQRPAVVQTTGARNRGAGLSDGQKLMGGLLALIAVATVIDIVSGPSADVQGGGSSGGVPSRNPDDITRDDVKILQRSFEVQHEQARISACSAAGIHATSCFKP